MNQHSAVCRGLSNPTGRPCGPRLTHPDAELNSHARMTILAISHDLTISQSNRKIFKSNCSGSNRIFTSQIELPKWFKSRFKSQSRLGFAHHCRRFGDALAMHHRLSGILTYCLKANKWEVSTPPMPSFGYGNLYLFIVYSISSYWQYNDIPWCLMV